MDKKTVWLVLILLVCIGLLIFLVNVELPPADGWTSADAGMSYILEGEPVTGWQDIEGSRYYFGTDGILRTGWQTIDEATYYLGTDGAMVTGWLERDGKPCYLCEDGVLATAPQKIDGEAYYFSEDGTYVTGIVEDNGLIYLYDDHGFLTQGWIEIDGSLYYGNENGNPLYGWAQIDGTRYYFDESGAAVTGWLELDGFTYYFYTDGAIAQGEVPIDGQVHRFASNGQHLVLVNPWNFVPEDYTVELVPISDTHQVAAVAYQDFMDMMADCEAAGFEPMVCSSYRTQEYQEELYQNRIKRYVNVGYSVEKATELAGRSVAVPGTSEHQLGLALDIVDDNNWRLDESQARMPTQKWLMENSWRYGWILRYPSEKSEFTGIIYEPWHYRYVGKAVAQEIYELGICLEEYLQMLTDSVG